MATNLSNPKSVLFFGAVFAQFVKPEMGWEWMLLIFITLIAVGFVMSAGFALLIDVFSNFLSRCGHFVDMGTGSIFIGLALWMLGEGAASLAPAR